MSTIFLLAVIFGQDLIRGQEPVNISFVKFHSHIWQRLQTKAKSKKTSSLRNSATLPLQTLHLELNSKLFFFSSKKYFEFPTCSCCLWITVSLTGSELFPAPLCNWCVMIGWAGKCEILNILVTWTTWEKDVQTQQKAWVGIRNFNFLSRNEKALFLSKIGWQMKKLCSRKR